MCLSIFICKFQLHPNHTDNMFLASCCIASMFLLLTSPSNAGLWNLHFYAVEVVLRLTFTDLKMFLSSSACVFLKQTVQCLLLNIPKPSFFFRIFQIIVLTKCYPVPLIDFPLFIALEWLDFLSLVVLLLVYLVWLQLWSLHAKPRSQTKRTFRTIYILNNLTANMG